MILGGKLTSKVYSEIPDSEDVNGTINSKIIGRRKVEPHNVAKLHSFGEMKGRFSKFQQGHSAVRKVIFNSWGLI